MKLRRLVAVLVIALTVQLTAQFTATGQNNSSVELPQENKAVLFDSKLYVWLSDYLQMQNSAIQRYNIDIEQQWMDEKSVPTYTPKLPLILIQNYSTPPKDHFTRVYMGIGAGTAFAQVAFNSFGVDKLEWGYNAEVVVGLETSPFFSIEAVGAYSLIRLGATEKNQGLYYLDDNYYFTPVVGGGSVSYGDMLSKVELTTVALRANMNLVGLWDERSRWQLLVSPRLGVGFSNTTLLGNGKVLRAHHATHLLGGIALGGGYMINEWWGVRLLSGVDYLWGDQLDLVPTCTTKGNYTWTTTLSFIFKL